MKLNKIGFIGLGLIGGSIARAVRQYYPDCETVAFDKNREALALATQEAVIDVARTSIDDNFQGCDYIFLCTPVAMNTAYLKQMTPFLHKDLILTDVGSVKTPIHEEAARLGLEEYFIGGHPMTGSESGFSSSRPLLLENAYYLLTPTEKTPWEKVKAYKEFAASLRALPIILEYKEHDYVTGTISHLPHIIAASLVNFVRNKDTKDELMKNLAAGGFKDITRIASSSPAMWQQICLQNEENLTSILDDYIHSLQKARRWFPAGRARVSTRCLSSPATTGIPCRTALPAQSGGRLPFTATFPMKPVSSPRLPPSWLQTESVLKTSESFTTGNLKKGFCGLNFMTRLPMTVLRRFF